MSHINLVSGSFNTSTCVFFMTILQICGATIVECDRWVKRGCITSFENGHQLLHLRVTLHGRCIPMLVRSYNTSDVVTNLIP